MEDECKVQLDASVDTQDSKQTMQGVKLHSKLTTALLVFALCLNAAAATAVLVFNRHTKGPGQDENNFGEFSFKVDYDDCDSIFPHVYQTCKTPAEIHLTLFLTNKKWMIFSLN